MAFEEDMARLMAEAVSKAVSPLKEEIADLKRLMTVQGGERPTDLLTLKQVAMRLRVSENRSAATSSSSRGSLPRRASR